MDAHDRYFGYKNMLICDDSMLSASLDVDPGLTIAALTKHAISHISVADLPSVMDVNTAPARGRRPDPRH